MTDHTVGAPSLAWQPPAAAVPEWLRLLAALLAADEPPPCADPAAGRVWWSARLDDLDAAVWACGRCLVLSECRAYALAADERHGGWGATTEAERRRLAGRSR